MWNTAGAATGSHALRAVARDSAGNLGTSPAVTVQVMNDSTPPLILALTPAANASNVSGATTVTARFDEPLNPSTVSAANFELRTAATNALVTATVSYDAATRTARLVPSAPLAPGAVLQRHRTRRLDRCPRRRGQRLRHDTALVVHRRAGATAQRGAHGGVRVRRGNRGHRGRRVRQRQPGRPSPAPRGSPESSAARWSSTASATG